MRGRLRPRSRRMDKPIFCSVEPERRRIPDRLGPRGGRLHGGADTGRNGGKRRARRDRQQGTEGRPVAPARCCQARRQQGARPVQVRARHVCRSQSTPTAHYERRHGRLQVPAADEALARAAPRRGRLATGRLLAEAEVAVDWGDGTTITRAPLTPDSGAPPRTQYLSQQFVERLCGADGGVSEELREEIERVIWLDAPKCGRRHLAPAWSHGSRDEVRSVSAPAASESVPAWRSAILLASCSITVAWALKSRWSEERDPVAIRAGDSMSL